MIHTSIHIALFYTYYIVITEVSGYDNLSQPIRNPLSAPSSVASAGLLGLRPGVGTSGDWRTFQHPSILEFDFVYASRHRGVLGEDFPVHEKTLLFEAQISPRSQRSSGVEKEHVVEAAMIQSESSEKK